MCPPKAPKIEQATPAAAPPPPNPTAENLKINERTRTRGKITANTARSRRTMRTDVSIPGKAGTSVARMGG